MIKCRLLLLAMGLLVPVLGTVWWATPALADAPPGFEDTLVTSVNGPTALAFTPDGRLLITTQPGQLYVYHSGSLTQALNLAPDICTNSERGLLGVTVDPDFVTNHHLYLYYTFRKSPVVGCPTGTPNSNFPVNRVSRFTLPDTNIIDPDSEMVLVDNILSAFGNHNAGDLHFGTDGLLYISIGDGGGSPNPNPAADPGKLAGKILRIGPDGSIPVTNPYTATVGSRRCGDPAGVPPGTGPCQEVIAYGLRNPFRFSVKPGTGSLYLNDVGQSEWEEIDEWPVGSDAPNYGWPTREGPCGRFDDPDNCSPTPAGLTDPIFSYNHNTNRGLPTDGCGSITGGDFVPAGIWPTAYEGAYLFSDYICGKIFRLSPAGGGGFILAEFVTALGDRSVVTMIFGPYNTTQALYYTSYAGGGQVRRIVYTAGGNQDPLAEVTAQPDFGLAPLLVTFDASGSSDPDNDPLTFDWDFGNGTVLSSTSTLTVTQLYPTGGIYTATLVARDNRGGVSQPATVRIDVDNNPPTPTILFPPPTTRFYVGQPLALQGQATDVEDGPLPDSALTWEMTLHHLDQQDPDNAHTHPFLSPTSGNNIPIIAPPPEDLRATALSYLEIKLTATDSLGRASSITQTLEPNRVNLTFVTQPVGFRLDINGESITTPHTLTSWQAYPIPVQAPLSQSQPGENWTFAFWSDGGAATHLITTPPTPVTYTAVYSSTPVIRFWFPVVGKWVSSGP